MPIPNNEYDIKEKDQGNGLNEDVLSEKCKLFDPEAGNTKSVNKGRHEISFAEPTKFIRNDRSSRNKYLTLSGHRRAESLGNVGQTRRNWSPPSPFIETEQSDASPKIIKGNTGR